MVLRSLCVLLSVVLAMVAAQPGSGLSPDFEPEPEMQFGNMNSSAVRQRHFYCLDFNESRADFPNDEYSEATNELTRIYNWAIMLQFPVLSYLDSLRKEYLFETILRLAQAGDGDNNVLSGLTLDDFCVARVFHYEVSTYEESVLVNIYFRGDIVMNPDGPNNPVTIAVFNSSFWAGVDAQDTSSPDSLVQLFRGRRALAIDVVSDNPDRLTMTEMNAHPFGIEERGGDALPASQDPTRRAVIISTSVGARNLENVEFDMEFADNPRPINFGLEAGDIVFIVFGSFFIAVVLGLVLLGFCIHPFFLA